jgi:hypothetical protein
MINQPANIATIAPRFSCRTTQSLFFLGMHPLNGIPFARRGNRSSASRPLFQVHAESGHAA